MTPLIDFVDKIEVIPETNKARNYNLFKPQPHNTGCNTNNEIMPLNEWIAFALFGDMYNFDMENALTLMYKAGLHIDKEYTARLSNIIPEDKKLPEAESDAIIAFWQKMVGYELKHDLDVTQVVNWALRFLVNGPNLEMLQHDYTIKYMAIDVPHTVFKKYLIQSNYSSIFKAYIMLLHDENSTPDTLRQFILDNAPIYTAMKTLCHAFLIANAKDIDSKINYDNETLSYSWTLKRISSNITSRGVNPNKWLISQKCDFALMRFLHILLYPLSTDDDTVSDYEPKLIPDNTDQSTSPIALLAREEQKKNQGIVLGDSLNDVEVADPKENGRLDEKGNLIDLGRKREDDFQEEDDTQGVSAPKDESSTTSTLRTLADALKKVQSSALNKN